jgi:single-strand DNA-binding protein
MINRVILVGRLTRDPQLRKTNSGKSVASFTLAVDRRFARNNGNGQEQQQQADFISCVAWDKTADFMQQYTHKGSLLGVEGRIQTRNYDDPNVPGRKVYVTEVVCEQVTFLEPKSASESRQNAVGTQQPAGNAYYPDEPAYDGSAAASNGQDTPTLNISSDDLPF